MAAPINGTLLLLYSDGQLVAYQKGITISVDTDLPDATNKESSGWAEHIQGMLNAKIDFTSLFSTLTPAEGGMQANALMDYIINRQSLLISILGFSFPIVAEADINSLTFDGGQETAMGLSGSLKVKGQMYCLLDASEQMMVDPDGYSNTYDTMTVSGISISSAINASGSAYVRSTAASMTDTYTYKVAFYLTLNSGELPNVNVCHGGTGASHSNTVACVSGLNIITLVATSSGSWSLQFANTAASNFSTTNIYWFNV